jgi:hypothetical protein
MPSESRVANPVIVFHFKNPSSHPESTLNVPINVFGGSISLEL